MIIHSCVGQHFGRMCHHPERQRAVEIVDQILPVFRVGRFASDRSKFIDIACFPVLEFFNQLLKVVDFVAGIEPFDHHAENVPIPQIVPIPHQSH